MASASQTFCAFMLAAGIAATSFGQTSIRITGTVKDILAGPITGAQVRLAIENISATTDAGGAYSIVRELSAGLYSRRDAIVPAPLLFGGSLYFGVARPQERVRIDAYTVSGRRVFTFVNQSLGRGSYRMSPLPPHPSSQTYVLRVLVGTASTLLKLPCVRTSGARADGVCRLDDSALPAAIAKQCFAADTLYCSAPGYAQQHRPIQSYAGTYNFTLEKTSFGLLSPQDGAMITTTRSPLLSWSPDTGAAAYDVFLNISRIDYDWMQEGSLLDRYTQIAAGITDDSITAPQLDDRWTYKWYVESVGASGRRSRSAVRTFSVYLPTIDPAAAKSDSVPVVNGCRDLDKNGKIEPYEDWRLPVETRVKDLLSRMTKEEKTLQLFFNAFNAPGAGWSLWLRDGDLPTVQRMAAKTRWGIPVIPTSDFICGYYTTFPVQTALAAARDLSLVYQCAAMQRDEQNILAFRGTLSPIAELGTKALYPKISDGCGENADFGAAMIRAMVCAYQNGPELNPKSILAMPGRWMTGQDDMPVDSVSIKYHLKPWYAAVDAGMAALLAGRGTDLKYFASADGASANGQMMELLRSVLHFDGVVCTDFLDTYFWSKCLNAGADVLGNADPGKVDMSAFAAQIPDERIDEACGRVLRVKFRMGLFDEPYGDTARADFILRNRQHLALAVTAAKRSLTMLKNDGVLPLSLLSGDTLVVAGERANDGKSYCGWGSSFHDKTILTYVEERAASSGVTVFHDSAAAQHFSAKAAVCVIGEELYANTPPWEDINSSCDVPEPQLQLIKGYKHAGTPVIVVVLMPRPYALQWLADSADAIIAAYRPGDGGGAAVTGLLFGDYAPSGRLPWQLPKTGGQVGLNDPKYAYEKWDLPYDIGATDEQRGRIRALINGEQPVNTLLGDSLYGDPLYQYGFGLQGWKK
jgi:beta-glucosidase